MLESMIEQPRPTRAEISDVATAVFAGSSCIMLSGETAAGKYPVQAVKAMALIALDAEKHIDYKKRFANTDFNIEDLTDALSHSAGQLAIDTKAACIVTSTMSGDTARMVSRNRCPMPIIGMTCREKTYRQMSMYWHVTPLLVRQFDDLEDLILRARGIIEEEGFAKKGDVVVLTGGITNTKGGTKLIHADVIE
jgi:pyruvate kinase